MKIRAFVRKICEKCRKIKEVRDLMRGEPTTKTPVNSRRNYNGPKLAKFLIE